MSNNDTLQQKKDMLDKLTQTMQQLMVEICIKVLAKCGHKVKQEDVLGLRVGEQLCEVICEQGVFILDRQDEQIVAYTPNPDYQPTQKETVH